MESIYPRIPQEVWRKFLHLLTLFVPLFTFYSLRITQIFLCAITVFYLVSEWQKLRGKKYFYHSFILKAQRPSELHHFARAPLFLALGVLGAISLFSWKASALALYQVGLCDTVVAFCGRKWGRKHLPFFRRKTVAGFLGYFFSALPLSLGLFPPLQGLTLSLIGALLESFPYKDGDNITIPLGVGLIAELFLR